MKAGPCRLGKSIRRFQPTELGFLLSAIQVTDNSLPSEYNSDLHYPQATMSVPVPVISKRGSISPSGERRIVCRRIQVSSLNRITNAPNSVLQIEDLRICILRHSLGWLHSRPLQRLQPGGRSSDRPGSRLFGGSRIPTQETLAHRSGTQGCRSCHMARENGKPHFCNCRLAWGTRGDQVPAGRARGRFGHRNARRVL